MKRIPSVKYPAVRLYRDDIEQIVRLLKAEYEQVQIVIDEYLLDVSELDDFAAEMQKTRGMNVKFVYNCRVQAESGPNSDGTGKKEWLSLDITRGGVRLLVSDIADPALSAIIVDIEIILRKRKVSPTLKAVAAALLLQFLFVRTFRLVHSIEVVDMAIAAIAAVNLILYLVPVFGRVYLTESANRPSRDIQQRTDSVP